MHSAAITQSRYMETPGQRIKAEREAKGLTQEQLAKMVGSSQSTIASLERRGSKSSAVLAKIAAALGLNALWLAEKKGPKYLNDAPELPPDEAALLDAYRRLPAGWAYYLRRKASELATIADNLPEFLFEACKAIPENGHYREWESRLDALVEERRLPHVPKEAPQ